MTPILLSLAVVIAAPAGKKENKPAPKLEGEWVLERFEGPKKDPTGRVTMTFTASEIRILEEGRNQSEDAGYKVDWTKKPAHLDIRPKGNGPAVLGIVMQEGDTAKLCFAFGGMGDRPTEFEGDAAKGIALIILKRVKEEKK